MNRILWKDVIKERSRRKKRIQLRNRGGTRAPGDARPQDPGREVDSVGWEGRLVTWTVADSSQSTQHREDLA